MLTLKQRLKLAYNLVVGKFKYGTICSNRLEATYRKGTNEVFVRYRSLCEADGYSREELFKMLREVRKHQRLQKWEDSLLEAAEEYAADTVDAHLDVLMQEHHADRLDGSFGDRLGAAYDALSEQRSTK